MDFDKLSLDSPMAQGNGDDDILNADDLLRDEAPTDGPATPPTDSRQASNIESFVFLPEEDWCCDYVSSEIYRNRGPVLQFINQNCADAATIIGGVRLPSMDVRLIPAYLARNRQLVKAHAVRQLTRHLVETQSAAGANESLCLDDYGMTYMLATISKTARAHHPLARQEGPLMYCMFPRMNSPATLFVNADGSPEKVHIINVYVHLYDVNRRRRAIIERAAKAEEARANAALAPPPPPPPVAVKRKGPPMGQPQGSQQVQGPSGAAATPYRPAQTPTYHHRQNPAPAVWQQPPPPPPVAQPPPPSPAPVQAPAPVPAQPAQDKVEHYPPMPANHAPINWPMSPRLPDFPTA